MAKTGFLDVSSLRCLLHLSVACLSKLLSKQLLPAGRQMIPTNWESDNTCTVVCFWVRGRNGGGNSSWERWKREEPNALQWDTKLISEGQNERGKNPTQLDQCGEPRVDVGFLWLFFIMTIFHLAVLFEDEVWELVGESVAKMWLWLPGSVSGMALREWSPVILPLSHRVSLKVQVKCPQASALRHLRVKWWMV